MIDWLLPPAMKIASSCGIWTRLSFLLCQSNAKKPASMTVYTTKNAMTASLIDLCTQYFYHSSVWVNVKLVLAHVTCEGPAWLFKHSVANKNKTETDLLNKIRDNPWGCLVAMVMYWLCNVYCAEEYLIIATFYWWSIDFWRRIMKRGLKGMICILLFRERGSAGFHFIQRTAMEKHHRLRGQGTGPTFSWTGTSGGFGLQ